MDEVFRLRPVPRRYRCDKCPETSCVILGNIYLCGDCFLEETQRRYGRPASSRRDEERAHATASST